MAGKGSAMPDLQLRMSKKIAQLTKVIYHLNNRNEDHDVDMQEMTEQYETEIEQILKDTADKCETFQKMMEAARDPAIIQRIHEDLEARYEDEKRRCLQELENIRKKSADKEAAIQKQASRQLDQLGMQIDQLEEQLQNRIKEINDFSSNANSSTAELQEQLMKAKRETEDAILTGNKKHNDMLADRMRLEDGLNDQIKELTNQLATETSGRKHAETTLSEERSRWEDERARLLTEATSSNANWKAKCDGLIADLGGEKTAARDAAKEASARERDAGNKISDLESALSKAQADLQNSLAGAASLTKDLQALGANAATETSQLQSQLGGAMEKIKSLESTLAEERVSFESKEATAHNEQKRLSAELADTQAALKQAEALIASLKQELEARNADIKDELAPLKAGHKKSTEYRNTIRGLELEIQEKH
eukprot:gene16000-22137_t